MTIAREIDIEIMKGMLKDLKESGSEITDAQTANYESLCESLTPADGLYCPACYINDGEKNRVKSLGEDGGVSTLKCYTCKMVYEVKTSS